MSLHGWYLFFMSQLRQYFLQSLISYKYRLYYRYQGTLPMCFNVDHNCLLPNDTRISWGQGLCLLTYTTFLVVNTVPEYSGCSISINEIRTSWIWNQPGWCQKNTLSYSVMARSLRTCWVWGYNMGCGIVEVEGQKGRALEKFRFHLVTNGQTSRYISRFIGSGYVDNSPVAHGSRARLTTALVQSLSDFWLEYS